MRSRISIVYRTSLGRNALKLVKLATPLWCILPLILCAAILAGMLRLIIFGYHAEVLAMSSMILSCLLIVMLGACLIVLLSEERIHINKSGLYLPFPLCLSSLSPKFRSWRDLVYVSRMESATKERYLQLQFVSGPPLILEERLLTRQDAQKLMLAIESFMGNKTSIAKISPDGKPLLPSYALESFTSLWESELSLSFRPTTFVPLVAGDILTKGRVQVLKPLSYGGSSAVYLAATESGEVVALKELVVPAYVSEEAREKSLELFRREAKLLAGLSHPDIAGIIDHFVEDARHYLVLEYIEGEDLRKLVKGTGKVRRRQVLRWASQMCEILQYLHTQQPPVIHRDLTPENFVVEQSGRLRLIDFGAANEFIGTATGTIIGKQGYIAPEQFKGKAVIQSDMYALGCTLHFLLTGRDPEPLKTSSLNEEKDMLSDLIASLTAQNIHDRPSAGDAARTISSIQQFSRSRV